MKIEQYSIWICDLNPQIGTEPGKVRPVLVVQTNLLNDINHPSTLVCPITTDVINDVDILRLHLKKGESNLKEDSDVLLDQMRAIDNRRFVKKVGNLKHDKIQKVLENLKIVLDL
ncbi:type II toxin-antitoxin system PemK/MazF family toxin [Candidatus Kapaibacterium sp.]